MDGPVASAAKDSCLLALCPHKGGDLSSKSLCFSPRSFEGACSCGILGPLWQLSPTLYAPLALIYSQITEDCTVLPYQPSPLPCLLPLQRDCSDSDIWNFFLGCDSFYYFTSHFHKVVLKGEGFRVNSSCHVDLGRPKVSLYLSPGYGLLRYGMVVKPFLSSTEYWIGTIT